MEEAERSSSGKAALPLILLAAVVQGWSLYALHHAITHHHWPATDQAWLIALYSLALFVPLSAQLLAAHAEERILWLFVAALSVAYFYFGWHFGAHISTDVPDHVYEARWAYPLTLLFGVLWLLALPFVQCRLTTGHWAGDYRALFTHAWHNKLMLAEAALFTGLFWFLLFLWQMLFHLLSIDFFRDLFEEPIFVYPVTALAFGCAMHLIGSITRLTSVVLEQVLNVMKWLATVAGFILALFTIALLFSVPGLLFTGQRTIGATWLLWLLAVMVLLLNAAYRDGSVPQPYPKWIAAGLRFIVPLTVIIALTALYALVVRARHYGLTVERFWALVVAGAGLLYACGYSIAAFRKGAWLGAISRVNVMVAIALIAIIAAALTPVLSPYRLAANSQYRLVQAGGLKAIDPGRDKRAAPRSIWGGSPLTYLRFDAGRYGNARLKELAETYAGSDSESVRRAATAMLAQKTRWEAPAPVNVAQLVGTLRIYPEGRTLDQALVEKLVADLSKPTGAMSVAVPNDQTTAGLFIDLNGDGIEEFVFLTPLRGRVYENRAGKWTAIGADYLNSPNLPEATASGILIDALTHGKTAAKAPKWNDLWIGTLRYRLQTPD
jgi:hypothetical protein